MVEQVFDVEMNVTVRVTIRDEDVIRRPVENVDGWRDDLYNLGTQDKVLEHLAFNAVMNNRQNAKMMDGWADLAEEAVTMDVIEATLERTQELR